MELDGPVPVERRLAAILAADVAGYSRLMGIDEEETLLALKGHRKALVDPSIAAHHGRIVKTTGDGMLVEFASAVHAVHCAVDVQRGMLERNAEVSPDKRIEFRVGINVGDIIIDGDDIFGDGVNVAARVENACEPGGVCVSGSAFEQVRGKTSFGFDDLGERTLKNIDHPVHLYSAWIGTATATASANSSPHKLKPLALPDKPSIAVLPFQNMSGDPEQEYFADGVVEDITTALSRFKELFVTARNSSFTYKGRAIDVKQVGRELGVRYVLEGSVRKSANRLRITGQLIDAALGTHLWADRFDGAVADVFELQDQITESVVGAIAPAIEKAEIDRAKRKSTDNLDAYNLYLRALAKVYQFDNNRQALEEALRLFKGAVEIDQDFASAYAGAAKCYVAEKALGWSAGTQIEMAEVRRLTQRAIALGKDDASALASSAWVLAYFARDLLDASSLIDRALAMNSNLADAWHFGAWIENWLGQRQTALDRFAHAMRLSPVDPQMIIMRTGTAHCYFFLDRYEEAISWAALALQGGADHQAVLRITAASNALAGRALEAHEAMARLRQLNPALRVSNLKEVLGPYGQEDLSRYEEAMRRAGLPE